MTRIADFEEAKRVAADLMERMRANLEQDGRLAPVAFVHGSRDPETGLPLDAPRLVVVALDLHSPEAKKASAARLRSLARQADATFVLTGAECSTVMCSAEGAAVSRTEAIVATLEHRKGGCTWLAPITRTAAGKAHVGKFEVLDGEPVGGDFGDFLHFEPQPETMH